MMRLIDADDWEPYFYEHCDDAGMIGAKNALDEMPTIDAAPVVRCKDCGYHTMCAIEHEVNFDEDFFCKWGIEYEIYKNQC